MSSIALEQMPDARGHFGPYGGRYVPETLMQPLAELEAEYTRAQHDPEFQREFAYYLKEFCGRPTPLYFVERLTRELGGARIYLKREDLLHTGAHKINNCIGQILLARRMGKTRIIAETGAGQHGVATATVAAMFGLSCVVYMGAVDCERQALNVVRMKMLGAEVVPVKAGQQTLKEAINEAMRDWVTNIRSTHYILGTVYGAHPYPLMVRNFQRVIGDEARRQALEQEKRLPNLLVACVGGGSNAMGLFYPFLADESVNMVGVEAGGVGLGPGQHAARFQGGSLGVLQGTRSYLLQDEFGQIQLTHSVSAGLDYAAVGPEHAWLRDRERVEYTYATDTQALEAFLKLARLEGIIPALESAHAVAEVIRRAPTLRRDDLVIVNLSGRGDKDVAQVAAKMGLPMPGWLVIFSGMPVLARHRFSTAEYCRMAETGVLKPDARVELLDGEIIDMAPIGSFHGGGTNYLNDYFAGRAKGRYLVSVQNPLHLDEHSEPQPDLMLLKRTRDFYRAAHPRPDDVFLLVEVADTSLAYDREKKLPAYGRAGIAEVWIVNLEDGTIEVHREPHLAGCGSVAVLRAGDQASPLAFPDAAVDVGELMRRS